MNILRHLKRSQFWLLSCLQSLLLLAFVPKASANPSTNQIVQTGPQTFQIGSIELNRAERSVSFPAMVRITNEVIEYALVTTDGKTHESLLTTEVSPTDLHIAALLLGIKPSDDLGDTNSPIRLQRNSTVRIEISWKPAGRQRSVPLERLVVLQPSREGVKPQRMSSRQWTYNGSFLHQGLFVAQEEGSIISLIRDPVALMNNAGIDRDNDDIHFPDPRRVPARGTAVTVRLRF